MEVMTFLTSHTSLTWLAIAAVLLAIEVATGTGWLLWAAGAAGATCLAALTLRPNLPSQIAIFAVLTIVSVLVSRRFAPRHPPGEDINDNTARVIGRQARVVAPFVAGRGRVSIDGKEWAATLVAGPAPIDGVVEVVSASGSELGVRSS